MSIGSKLTVFYKNGYHFTKITSLLRKFNLKMSNSNLNFTWFYPSFTGPWLDLMSVNDFVLLDRHSCNVIYQLQTVSIVVRKSHKTKKNYRPIRKRSFFEKQLNISSCLLVVACVVVLSIPAGVYIGLHRINSPYMMNCTFITVIFYCKNNWRCYVPNDWKFWKTWKYVDGLNNTELH